ncbi:snapalysin [Streptomyces hilarionis]|uniref:snapalysin n=1 Tax=Streptomyces hilarionis TaxID=2839954 RepID=UPI00211A8269|nr:snapalysin [Streptomyces hilarionis]MCQ9132157.1 snapalysin [Streptomyces hilarionis]
MTSTPTSSTPAKTSRRLLALGLGAAFAVLGGALPASAQSTGSAGSTTAAVPSAVIGAGYTGSAREAADNKAFFEAVLTSVAKKQAANPGLRSVTVYYNASQAPSFRSQISSAASVWNSSVSNVKLQSTSGGADFSYYEGNDSRGSYASTNGHGSGYIFLDYAQNRQYDSVRVAAHETGHVLGLPDHYSGPCSELMSGGGPGTSCTNRYPNATERSRVNQLWANGLAKALDKLNKVR